MRSVCGRSTRSLEVTGMNGDARKLTYGAWLVLASYVIAAGAFLWGTKSLWSLIGPFFVAGGLVVLGVAEVASARIKVSRLETGAEATTAQKSVLIALAATGIVSLLGGIYGTWMR